MADNQDPQTDIFKQVEEAFSQLELNQKARFLAQEVVSTACEAVQAVMDFVTYECESIFEHDPSPRPSSEESQAN